MWREKTLADVASWASGGTPRAGTAAYYNGSIPWAVIGDLNDGLVTQTKGSVTEEGLAASAAKIVPEGTILVAMYGSIGKLGIAGTPMATNQAIATAQVHECINSKFLFYYLLGQRHALDAAGKGATQRNISQSILKPWPIRYPDSLDEQRRIVTLLEDHLSRLDAARSGLSVNVQRLDRLRQSLIDDVFERMRDPAAAAFLASLLDRRQSSGAKVPTRADIGLIGTEERWPVASLEEVTDPERVIRYGILKPASEVGDVPYVEVRDLRARKLDPAMLKRTSATLDQQFAGARLRGGDVVVAVRGSFERSAVVPPELEGSNISRDVVRLAPLAGMNPAYLRYWYETSTSKRYLRRHARGVAVRGVNVGTLRAMPIPVVSTHVQDAVVAQIADGLASMNRIWTALEESQRRASSLTRALLAAAFSGRLTAATTEPSDFDEMRSA